MTRNQECPLPTVVGRYQVARELGKGAMGRVLLCHDPVLDRRVAVKHLRSDLAIPPEHITPLIERMRQEARASARVTHPNLVALYDMGEDPHVGLFLVFEYIEGPTLKDRLEQGPIDKKAAARLAIELGTALSHAHKASVLHRDVKPENVMLAQTGGKIADFGIARIPDSTLTQGGSILGTPAYSAPEAIRSARFSPQSDQFSLAATLYEAISGRRAFPGDDAVAVATKIATEDAPPIALLMGFDLSVDRVLSRGLSKQPKSRFPTCEEFGRALADALLREPRAALSTVPEHEALALKRPRLSLLWTLTAALSLVGGGWWLRQEIGGRTPASMQIGGEAADDEEEVILPIAWLIERAGLARATTDTAKPEASAKETAPEQTVPPADEVAHPVSPKKSRR